MMTSKGRAQAIYNAVAASNSDFGKLNDAEKQQVLGNLTTIFGAGDLAYLVANAQINPGSLTTPAGATTTPAALGAPVSVVTPTAVVGLGTLS